MKEAGLLILFLIGLVGISVCVYNIEYTPVWFTILKWNLGFGLFGTWCHLLEWVSKNE